MRLETLRRPTSEGLLIALCRKEFRGYRGCQALFQYTDPSTLEVGWFLMHLDGS